MTTLLVIAITAGCGEGDPSLGTAEYEAQTSSCLPSVNAVGALACDDGDGMMGGLRFNDVVTNSFVLDPNRRAFNALVSTDLQSAAWDSFVQQGLSNTNARARRTLQYIVECALPQGSHVQFWTQNWSGTFDGVGGVAPQWATGACDARCQQTVSACLYARINGDDRVVPLSVRRHIAGGGRVVDQYWKDHYPRLEAAYWGNYFATPAIYAPLDMHACFGFDASLGDPDLETKTIAFRKRYCGAQWESEKCSDVMTGPCGSTLTCPIAAGAGKQCKGDPADPNQAVGACTPVPWEDACTSTNTTPADYPTVTVYRAPSCAHPDFLTGAPLDRECSACVAQVANTTIGAHCTNEWWGPECVAEARKCPDANRAAGKPLLEADPTVGPLDFPLRLGTSDLVDTVCKDADLKSCCTLNYKWSSSCVTRAQLCAKKQNAGLWKCVPPPQP